MSEKPEDDFDEEDAEVAPGGGDDGDLDHLMRDFETQRRRAPKNASGVEPAWRRLERLREEKHTAELVSDFDDYEVGDSEEDSRERQAPGRNGNHKKKRR
jgi:hypothetical protein